MSKDTTQEIKEIEKWFLDYGRGKCQYEGQYNELNRTIRITLVFPKYFHRSLEQIYDDIYDKYPKVHLSNMTNPFNKMGTHTIVADFYLDYKWR